MNEEAGRCIERVAGSGRSEDVPRWERRRNYVCEVGWAIIKSVRDESGKWHDVYYTPDELPPGKVMARVYRRRLSDGELVAANQYITTPARGELLIRKYEELYIPQIDGPVMYFTGVEDEPLPVEP